MPAAAGDLLALVVAARGLADGVVGLDHLGVDDARGRLRGPALVLAQQLPQPGDQRLRQAAAVPPLEERVYRLPRREIDREGTPLDPVLHHIGNRVAHRPQVMDHRPANGNGKVPHYLACPRLEYRPLLIGQV